LISFTGMLSIFAIDPSAIAYFSSRISTINAWIIASVSGKRTIKVVPSPSFVRTSTSPPSASILDFTTSSPTPRPEISVIFFAIEKLGRNKRLIISFWLMFSACSAVITPRSTALSLTAATSIPLPSSPTSMITLLPSWKAFKKIEPTSGFPLSIRVALSSRPWSAELRSKCCNGSPIWSTTVLSNSVSSPVIYNSIFFPNLRERSRIIRGNLFTTLSIGTIRTFITDSCRFVVIRSKYSICSWKDWF